MDAPTAKGVGMTLIGLAGSGGSRLCLRPGTCAMVPKHPLAEHRVRMLRMATGYQRHRTNLKDVYDIVTDVLVEVARATETGEGVSGSTR